MSGNKCKKSVTELEEYQKTEDWKDDALEYLLSPLSREEIIRACSLTPKSTNPHKPTLISTVELLEPPKQIVFQIFNCTKIIDVNLERRAFVVAVDTNTERCYEAIILFNINNINSNHININNIKNNIRNINHNYLKINDFGDILEEWRSVMDVQPSLTSHEYVSVEKVIKSSPILRDMLKEEGYDIEKVYVDLWTSGRGYRGTQEADSGSGRRLGKPYMFYMENEGDNLYARPIRGITPVIDLNKMEIIRFDRYESKVRIPNNKPNYFESEEELIEPLKPLLISQPNGPSFKIKGHKLTWQNWEFRVGFTPKEGAIIQIASFADPRDPTNKRMILYRGSLVEMVVPYGDPADPTYRKNAFDVGEEGIGKNINSLKRGCDCLGEISYLDAHVNDSFGDAEIVRNAICIHEEDDGLLYKHTDWRSGQTFTERSRRLVIQFFATIANYDYGFVWYFHLDGKIDYEAKLTGSVSTEMYGDQANNSDDVNYIFGTKVDRDVYAPIHQHFFTVRLDFNIDGVKNWVSEINPEKVPVSDPRNVQSNAFYAKEQLFKSENEAKRNIVLGNRCWRISNLEKKNRLNGSPSYLLMPKGNSHPLADPSAAVMLRATHLQHHLWVTPYNPQERFPAGEYPTQSAGSDGLIRYTQHNRSIDGVDLVVWYTFGVFHVVRPEEWPIMPITREGFHLLPFGFCDRNPRMIWKPSSFVSRFSKDDERELRADASHDEKEWANGNDKEIKENEMNNRVDHSLRGNCKICFLTEISVFNREYFVFAS